MTGVELRLCTAQPFRQADENNGTDKGDCNAGKVDAGDFIADNPANSVEYGAPEYAADQADKNVRQPVAARLGTPGSSGDQNSDNSTNNDPSNDVGRSHS